MKVMKELTTMTEVWANLSVSPAKIVEFLVSPTAFLAKEYPHLPPAKRKILATINNPGTCPQIVAAIIREQALHNSIGVNPIIAVYAP